MAQSSALSGPSHNFGFLESHDPTPRLATLAEKYLADAPSTALVKLRRFGELQAQQVGANPRILLESVVGLSTQLGGRL